MIPKEKNEFSFTYEGREYRPEAKGRHVVAPELTVEVVRREIPEFDAVHWTIWFSNPSDRNSGILSEIHDCDITVPLDEPPVLPQDQPVFGNKCVTMRRGVLAYTPENAEYMIYRLGGAVNADEFRAVDRYLSDRLTPPNDKRLTLETRSCTPSDGTMPFFDVHAGDRGAMVAIGWTGDWRASFESVADGINVQTGLKNARFYLEPGEKVRTSSVLVMNYEGDVTNKFRRLIAKYFSHRAAFPYKNDGMLAVNAWGALPSDKMTERIAEYEKADVPYEMFWIDAGWYGDVGTECKSEHEGNWWSYTGDWRVSERIHPDKLHDVRDALAKTGKHIMLWFEPERMTDVAAKKVKKLVEHPEWLLRSAGTANIILNYGAPGAVDYMYDTLSAFIDDLKIGCYRQDFNAAELAEIFRENDAPDRRGILEIKHICGMYELFVRLLARFPNLYIDNCASGGRRIDIEMLSRTIIFWRSDYMCLFNCDDEIVQAQNSNISTLLPYSGASIRRKGDIYSARSAYSASFGIANYGYIYQTMSEAEFATLSRIAHEYMRVRKFFGKDFYNLGSDKADLTAWAIWQYHDPETNSGIVMAFRRPESPFEQAKIRLKGLPADAKLEIESSDDGTKFASGADLAITLPQKRSSTLLLYKLEK